MKIVKNGQKIVKSGQKIVKNGHSDAYSRDGSEFMRTRCSPATKVAPDDVNFTFLSYHSIIIKSFCGHRKVWTHFLTESKCTQWHITSLLKL